MIFITKKKLMTYLFALQINFNVCFISISGQVGDWENWLSKEQSDMLDKAIKERMDGMKYQPQL